MNKARKIPDNCTFCGLCCTLTVKLSGSDIKRIERAGVKREKFVETDREGKPLLRNKNGWCVFLKQKGSIGLCSIYANRPEACREFPGRALCDLAENPFYNLVGLIDKNSEETKRIMQLLKNAPALGKRKELRK